MRLRSYWRLSECSYEFSSYFLPLIHTPTALILIVLLLRPELSVELIYTSRSFPVLDLTSKCYSCHKWKKTVHIMDENLLNSAKLILKKLVIFKEIFILAAHHVLVILSPYSHLTHCTLVFCYQPVLTEFFLLPCST